MQERSDNFDEQSGNAGANSNKGGNSEENRTNVDEAKSNSADEGTVGADNEATLDGGVAVEGGKLAGNGDDFDGELDAVRPKPVPGADPNNGVTPPNDRDLRQ